MDDLASLELNPKQMHAMTDAVAARLIDHIASLPQQATSGDMDVADLCRAMREPAPERGVALETVLEPMFKEWIPRSFNCASPGYMAYVPGGGVFPSALADFISNGVNRYTGVWNAAPLLVQLEANVLEWFRQWMGFPEGSRGLLTTGGSMATFSAVVAAREQRLGDKLRDGVLYVTTQAHHCVSKAARLAGILPDRVRSVATDAELRMDIDALAQTIARDRQAGLKPFFVVSSAGTTNTGTIDPIDRVADLCAREELWHHVDGAYGGFFHLCPELRERLAGLSRADSLVLDPHKGLFLPYGTGALLIRNGEALRAAHSASAHYLPPQADEEFYDPVQFGPELSRDFRGLRVWLPIKLFGMQRYRAALLEKHQLAVRAAQHLSELNELQLLNHPELSLFAFHVRRPSGEREDENEATRLLIEKVNAKGRVMLTPTTIDGRFLGRVCVLCFRTRQAHMDACVEDIAEALGQKL